MDEVDALEIRQIWCQPPRPMKSEHVTHCVGLFEGDTNNKKP